jgi:urease accessory protein
MWSERGEGGFAAPAPEPPVVLQRAAGRIDLSFRLTAGRTGPGRLYQSGVGKARLPDPGPGRPVEAVLINTAGGLTDGDRLETAVAWHAGTRAVVTTQAAEKVYRARAGGLARVTTTLSVEAGATAEYLPQEAILFDRAGLDRTLTADVDAAASLLVCEAFVFGRAAMGETVATARLSDRWRIRRGGQLIFADGFGFNGSADVLAPRAALGGAGAVASLLLVAPDAMSRLDAARDLIEGSVSEAGASAWNGMLAIRLLAPTGAMLRHDLIRVLTGLRGPLPRVWMC